MSETDHTPTPGAFSGRRWHDMGGKAAGPVEPEAHDYALWEKRVDALMVLCSERGLLTVDALRRVLEDMGEEAFETMTYYERWIAAITQCLIEAGTLDQAEIGARMEEVARRGATYGEVQRDG